MTSITSRQEDYTLQTLCKKWATLNLWFAIKDPVLGANCTHILGTVMLLNVISSCNMKWKLILMQSVA